MRGMSNGRDIPLDAEAEMHEELARFEQLERLTRANQQREKVMFVNRQEDSFNVVSSPRRQYL